MPNTPHADPAHSPRTLSLLEANRVFVEHCRVGKCLSGHTLRAYASDLADFAKSVGAERRVADVSSSTVRDYAKGLLDTRRLKPTSVKRRLASLRACFAWLEREELVATSIFHKLSISIRTPRRLPRALAPEEMSLLLRASRPSRQASHESALMACVVAVLFSTGLRVGELVSVGLEDVSTTDGTIQVRGKGNRERRVFVESKEARGLIHRYLTSRQRIATGSSSAFLLARTGGAISTSYIRRRLRALATRAGLSRRVTPHMLRHTAATQLLEAGVDIRMVQRLLGHTSITTTQIYAEVRDEALRSSLARADTFGRVARAC